MAVTLLGNLASARTSSGPKTKPAGIKSSRGLRHSRSRRARHSSWKRHGQQKIDADRARKIQAALVREKYMSGEPTGKWDQATKDALVRYQADHGWQTKVVPDSRALIELGLGPKHEGLVNPESLAAVPNLAVPNATSAPAISGAGNPQQR